MEGDKVKKRKPDMNVPYLNLPDRADPSAVNPSMSKLLKASGMKRTSGKTYPSKIPDRLLRRVLRNRLKYQSALNKMTRENEGFILRLCHELGMTPASRQRAK